MSPRAPRFLCIPGPCLPGAVVGKHYFTAWTDFPNPVSCYGDLVRALKEGRVRMPGLPIFR